MSKPNVQFITNGPKTRAVFVDHSSDQLQVGNYAVEYSQYEGFYLLDREPFSIPQKIYGGSTFPERILSTYTKLKRGMGVLLSGPKGTGKTVEAKITCQQSNMPVIMITSAFAGSSFQDFIESIKTPSVILIDEFEKVYDDETERNFFLSIMDGVAKSRHLFLLTSNTDGIGEYFSSRPGRVRYHKKYDYLSDKLIEEIVNDRIKNKKRAAAVVKALASVSNMSVDSLTCIIDECNLYNETPKDFMSFFNVKTERPRYYDVTYTTRAAVPKAKLPEDLRRDAKNAAYNYNEYNETVENFDELCEVREVVYHDRFATPFTSYDYDDEDSPIHPSINLEWLFDDNQNRKRVSWRGREIVEFKESRKGFTAVHRDGSVIKGTPAQSRFIADS